jgi:hypothetical protein
MKLMQGVFKIIKSCCCVDRILCKINKIEECSCHANSTFGDTRDSNHAAKELLDHFLVLVTGHIGQTRDTTDEDVDVVGQWHAGKLAVKFVCAGKGSQPGDNVHHHTTNDLV